MNLTNLYLKKLKPTGKTQKHFDGNGLYIEVSPKGGMWWRLKYHFEGKEKRLSLGTYPNVSLKNARERKNEERKQIANGIDPSESRMAAKQTKANQAKNSFEVIAREWFLRREGEWAASHSVRIIRRLEQDIFPRIGGKPIATLKAHELLETIRKIEERGAVETAHRALSTCSQIFRYAIATGRADSDPTRDLRGALIPVKGKHFASVTEPEMVREILLKIDGYQGTTTVCCALRLAPLVFVRPGELRHAKWEDIDLKTGEWRFLVTKTNTPHIVPLSSQAIAILEEIQPFTGSGTYVFPSARSPKGSRAMSDNAMLAAMRSMGIPKEEMTTHGFRAMARTILDEILKVRPDYIEHQLAHAVRDPNGRAYNRTAHLTERKEMMQQWADYLDDLKKPLHN